MQTQVVQVQIAQLLLEEPRPAPRIELNYLSNSMQLSAAPTRTQAQLLLNKEAHSRLLQYPTDRMLSQNFAGRSK